MEEADWLRCHFRAAIFYTHSCVCTGGEHARMLRVASQAVSLRLWTLHACIPSTRPNRERDGDSLGDAGKNRLQKSMKCERVEDKPGSR